MKWVIFSIYFFERGAIKHKVWSGTIAGHFVRFLSKTGGAEASYGACKRDFNPLATFVSNCLTSGRDAAAWSWA
jgi:hypothetical protein